MATTNTPAGSPHHHVTVAPSKPARALQTVQGAYYILAGLLVAVFIQTIQGGTDRPMSPADTWPIRAVALAVAAFGVVLLISGRRERSFVSAGVGMWVALALLAQTAAGMFIGHLPYTFLLDAALELLFVCLWVAIMFARAAREIDRANPLPS
jgi:hypothetical protein